MCWACEAALAALKAAALCGLLLAVMAVDAGAQNAPGGMLYTAAWLLGITLAENGILGWIGKLQRLQAQAQTRPATHERKDRRQLTETTI